MAPTFNALVKKSLKTRTQPLLPETISQILILDISLEVLNPRGVTWSWFDPKNSNNYLIKRIIGLEGDTIVPLGFNQVEREPLKLKKDQVWVESDAGYGYRDSNIFGPVHIKSIQ